MAKQVTNIFSKFGEALNKAAKQQIDVRGFSDIDEYIDTGNYMLNAQLSGSIFGGFPNTRSYAIAGESGAGKTYLCLNTVRNAQKKSYYVIYIDTEGALDTTTFLKFGCNLEQLGYHRIGVVGELKLMMNEILETAKKFKDENVKVYVIIDSVSMLESQKAKDDIEKGKTAADMGTRAKELRSLFRLFTLDLSNLKIPFVFTSHLSPGMDQYTPDGMGGGKGPEYAATGILYTYKAALRDDDKKKIGILVRSKVQKARLCKPIDIEFHIPWSKPMNPYVGLHNYVSWEKCGVARGKKITEKEYNKLPESDKKKCREWVINEEGKDVLYYAQLSDMGRNWCIKWNGDVVPVKQLFSSRVFTQKVLEELDENVIKPMLQYSSFSDAIEQEELQNISESSFKEDSEENTEDDNLTNKSNLLEEDDEDYNLPD